MNITYARYLKPRYDDGTISEGSENQGIEAVIDGVTTCVPLAEGNRHYAAIIAMVEAGELVIQEADV